MDEKAPGRRGKIDFLALAIHGCVTRQRLLDAGVGRRAIQQALEDKRLHRVHAGVYAVGRPLTTPLEHAAAAVLACGDGSALGGLSALAFADLHPWPRTPIVHVVRRVRRPGIEIHQTTTLTRADVRSVHRIRATTPERTLLDTAPQLTPQTLATPFGYEVDAWFPTERVIVELDSEEWHLDRRAFPTDRERDAHHAAHGVLAVRLLAERLTASEADRLHRILATHRRRVT